MIDPGVPRQVRRQAARQALDNTCDAVRMTRFPCSPQKDPRAPDYPLPTH